MAETQPLVQIHRLTKAYGDGDHNVLDALELDISRGEIVAVVGRSGSGKSTLLHLVGQMDQPDGGTIRFDGRDTAGWGEQRQTLFRRRHLGFVFQAYNLLPTLTVGENVALPLELCEIEDADRARMWLQRLGIDHLADRYPDQISGGEQQRTAIARALVHGPSLIIADEPTGNLDADTAADVVAAFEHAVREAGAAVLMATHSLEMTGHADRVLMLKHGALVAAT